MTDARTPHDGASPSVATASVVPESRLVERLWRGAQGLGVTAAAMIGLGAALHSEGAVLFAYFASIALGGGAALAALWLGGRAPDWRAATQATAGPEGIRIGAGDPIATSELTQAVVTPRRVSGAPWLVRLLGLAAGERVHVELRRRGFLAWPIRFATRTIEEARAIVDALGLGAGRRAITRKVMSPVIQPKVTFPAIFGGVAAAVAAGVLAQVIHPAFGALGAWLPLAIVGVYTFGLIKTKVTIGADGVSVRWLGRPTTLALSDIAGVEVVPGNQLRAAVVRITRKNGTPFDIKVGLRGGNPFEPFVLSEECERIAERIREAIALGERAQPVEFRAWAAHRSALPVRAWMAMLRGALDAYRNESSMPFSAADLWALLENVQASPAERVAAAVAVSAASDDRTRARLRAVAAATAVPRLRVALDAAAEGDDDRLASVLGELRAEELARPRDEELARPRDEELATKDAAPVVRVRVDAVSDGEGSAEPARDDDAPADAVRPEVVQRAADSDR